MQIAHASCSQACKGPRSDKVHVLIAMYAMGSTVALYACHLCQAQAQLRPPTVACVGASSSLLQLGHFRLQAHVLIPGLL